MECRPAQWRPPRYASSLSTCQALYASRTDACIILLKLLLIIIYRGLWPPLLPRAPGRSRQPHPPCQQQQRQPQAPCHKAGRSTPRQMAASTTITARSKSPAGRGRKPLVRQRRWRHRRSRLLRPPPPRQQCRYGLQHTSSLNVDNLKGMPEFSRSQDYTVIWGAGEDARGSRDGLEGIHSARRPQVLPQSGDQRV